MSFEDPSRRAVVAGVALRLVALATLLLLGADGFQIAVVGSQGLSTDTITFDDLVVFGAAVLYVAALLVAVVAFTRWEHRVARNARGLDSTYQRSPAALVACWFVPVLNFVLPYRLLGELWRASGRDGSTGPAYLGAWWGCWIGGTLLGNLAGRVSAGASTAAVAQLGDVIDIVSNALVAIAAVLAVRLVADLTRRQVEARDQRAATSSSSESTSLGPGRLK